LFSIAALSLIWSTGWSAPVDFARDVHPILLERCAGCHKGDRALNTRAELLKVVVPGKAGESLLIARVSGKLPPQMPMGGRPLSAGEIDTLRRWIDEGAVWNSAQPVTGKRPPLALRKPESEGIDSILQAPGNVVADEVFVRRAYLDLWGLLPSPEQRSAFLKHNSRPKLIEALLANRQNYAENWISFWNDLLHNDEGVTYIGDRKSITPWLLNALKDNMPYDDFVRELLNPRGKDAPDGFLTGVNWRGDVNASQTPLMQAAQNSAQVFLGVNLKCNSCHDSFISYWKLKEAYGLASFFSKEPLEIYRCDIATGQKSKPSFLYPELGSIDENAPLEDREWAVAQFFTKPENGRFARTYVNRIWKRLFGWGIVEPIDDMDATPYNRDLLDWLSWDFVEHGYDTQYLLKQIMSSRAYQLPVGGEKPAPVARRLEPEEFVDAISSITGEWLVKESSKAEPGSYSRDWRLKANPLTRALGRPMRDLAVTERQRDISTLQTLELVNGQTLTSMLHLGALRMMGKPESVPDNLFDSGIIRSNKVSVDIDVTGSDELRLLLVDSGSYDTAKVAAGWMRAEFLGPNGAVQLPTNGTVTPKPPQPKLPPQPPDAPPVYTPPIKGTPVDAITARVPSELVYDIRGKGYTRFRAEVVADESSTTSDISPQFRAFIFNRAPNIRQLVRVEGERPQPLPPVLTGRDAIITRVYEHALGRDPSDAERKIAREFLQNGVDGLEDLLWAILMSAEFQYIS